MPRHEDLALTRLAPSVQRHPRHYPRRHPAPSLLRRHPTPTAIRIPNHRQIRPADREKQLLTEMFRTIVKPPRGRISPSPEEVYTFPDADGNELNVDCDNITEDEVANAIKNLKNHKAAGIDQIPAELLKKGGDIMLKKLTVLCNTCWELGNTPLDWRKGAIMKLPKKGDLSDCGNWRGITLPSIPGKTQGTLTALTSSPECDKDASCLPYSESQSTLQDMTTSAGTEAGKVGLRISCQKTKVMQVGDQETNTNLHISGEPVENVRQFTYLGSTMTAEGDTDTDISARICKAASVFRRMNPVWNSGKISRVLKTKLLQSVVIPTALYACETWKIPTKMRNKLDAFQQRCLRKILHITYRDRITNKEVYHRTGTKPLSITITITERRMRYAGHVLRMTSDRHAKTSMFWKPEGKRKRGRPKLTWRRTLQKDLESKGVSLKDAESLAKDRAEWRRLAAQCALHGRN
ncbi:hypothetical protein Bbelb_425190 [Branchiostoma belcheri]|nr:hypothetical protein Bbelb_425190 [Branchiostoma belcheri]